MIAALLAPRLCWSCGARAPRGRALCHACRRALVFLPSEPVVLAGVRVWAPVAYDGPGRDLVRALKFRGALGLVDEMSAIAVATAPNGLQTSAPHADVRPALVPVPLHPARLRRRGFNQAAVLAEAIGRRSGLVVSDCLRRSGPGVPQVGRGRQARLGGPAGAIAASGRVPPAALVVDDVVTTGATIAACAAALRGAGTKDVAAIAFARTPGR